MTTTATIHNVDHAWDYMEAEGAFNCFEVIADLHIGGVTFPIMAVLEVTSVSLDRGPGGLREIAEMVLEPRSVRLVWADDDAEWLLGELVCTLTHGQVDALRCKIDCEIDTLMLEDEAERRADAAEGMGW